MDLLLSSTDPVTTNLMGSEFVQVSELYSPTGKTEAQVEAATPTPTAVPLLPPPPPLTPAPEFPVMEEIKSDDCSEPLPAMDLPETPVLAPQESLEEELNRLIREANSFKPQPTRVDNTLTSTSPIIGPQIMTRKRSSMSAGSGTGSNIMSLSTEHSQGYTDGQVNEVPIAVATVPSSAVAPPKKKKKYTPKPKKTPTAPSLPVAVPVMEGSAPPPPPPTKPNKPKSTKKKASPVSSGVLTLAGGALIADTNGSVGGSVKPKKPSKPKAPKKKPAGSGAAITGSGKSKSTSKKKTNDTPPNTSFPQNQQPGLESAAGGRALLVPPLKIHMPKLTKMVASVVKNEPGEGEDWDENGEPLDPLVLAETELLDSSDTGGAKGRKKKSKGRNGNIYIGVFNRIEWMKLQNEFGFGSVNNFGTFVLQTMRRVHGDIQFWCDVAVASGIYPDLDHYKWTNGFPHAVNKEGQYFTPEPDVRISEEKREEVVKMAKGMWDQRLQILKQQQQQLTGVGGVEGEDAVIEEADVVEVDDEEDDDEEDSLMMPGLENYLENMATGRYSPLATADGGSAQLPTSAGQGNSLKTVALTEEEVNKIWNEQMNDSDNVEKFGKLFSFINSIAANGKREDEESEDGVNGAITGGNKGDEGEGHEAVGVGAN